MTLHVKDGGTWKQVTNLYVKDAGSWSEVTSGQVKDGGSWKEFHTTSGGGGGGSPTYSIQQGAVTIGTTSSSCSISLDSTGAISWSWSASDSGSNPPGFGDGYNIGAVQDGFGTVTFTSYCKTASPGTRVIRSFTVSVVLGNGTANPLAIELTHQF